MDIIIPSGLRSLNNERCDRWHPPGDNSWTLGDWGNALAGETGELCNVVKKMRRRESEAHVAYNTPGFDELEDKFAEEVADVLLYLDLLCWKAKVPPTILLRALKAKFNHVSEVNGWPDLKWEP